MPARTYISVLTNLLQKGMSEEDMLVALAKEFPEKTEKVIKARLRPAIKYIISKSPKQKADGIAIN